MNKFTIDDDFLYTHLNHAENLMLEQIPHEILLTHTFSKQFEHKMAAQQKKAGGNHMNMSKKLRVFVAVIAAVVLLSAVTVFAASQYSQIFKARNGDEITVVTSAPLTISTDKNYTASDADQNKIGDTIKGKDGQDYVVYAIGEDGTCIAMKADMYAAYVKDHS